MPVIRMVMSVGFAIIFVFQGAAQEKQSAAALIEKTLTESGLQAAEEKFKEMTASGEDAFLFDEREFIGLGSKLIAEQRFTEAVVVLKMAAEAFPESPNPHFVLSNAYGEMGDDELQYAHVRQAQQLRRQNQLAQFLKDNEGKLCTTAEEVINRHVEAIGGREAMLAVKSMVVKFSSHGSGGNMFTLVRYYKRPYYYRQQIEGSEDFAATDGTRVWRVDAEGWHELTTNDYLPFASIDNYFLDYSEKGISYEFVGVEMLDAPVYHLRRTYWFDRTEELFFSAETGLLAEVLTPYFSGPSYFSYWNYRDVGGIKIPHVMIRNIGDLGPPHGIVLEEVQLNAPLDDTMFVKPE